MSLHAESDPVETTTSGGAYVSVPRMLCSDCQKPLVAAQVWWDTELGDPQDRPAIWLGKVHLILVCDNFLCSAETQVRLVIL